VLGLLCSESESVYHHAQLVAFSFFFFFLLAVLGIEPRALDMLGKCSATELYSQAEAFFYFI
jgi:hypothetical protein